MSSYWIGVIAAFFSIWLTIGLLANVALVIDFKPWMYVFFLLSFLGWYLFPVYAAAFIIYIVYHLIVFLIIDIKRNNGLPL